MTHQRLYSTAVIAGFVFAAGIAMWRRAGGSSASGMLLWAAGGFAIVMLLALLADIGLRLQRRDVPPPRSSDEPGTRTTGRLDNE
ncbi:MAG TPA: hypothetical protein VFT04_12685 [Gemmatimonadales bacterium]|nr:hypothetical protein [Gemmatimonadales bacterium]